MRRVVCTVVSGVLGTLAASAQPAIASTYHLLTIDGDKAAVIDTDSVVGTGQLRTGWWGFAFAEVQHDGGKSYDRVLFKEQFDCSLRRVRGIAAAAYDGGTLAWRKETNEDWSDPEPGSGGDKMLRIACGDMEAPDPAVQADLPHLNEKIAAMIQNGQIK